MTTLVLWRHGNTEWNTEHRIQGHSDVPLSPLGRTQAVTAAPLLAALSPDAIVSSDLARCTQTANELATHLALPVRRDARLRERGWGEWEGLTLREVARRWPESYARKDAKADAAELGHGIERPMDVRKRVGEALREAVSANPDGTTVVVTHGGAARYGMFDLLGWPVDLLPSFDSLVNCHYSALRRHPSRGWLLSAHNVGVARGEPGYE